MANRRPIPPETRQVVYNKYGGHCAYCGKKLTYREMQVDHVLSVCNNGENNDIGNLMPACRMCNFYKSTYTIEQFRARLGKILGRLNKRVYLANYLGEDKNGLCKNGYAWHISDLKIYDKPKELGEFRKVCLNGKCSDCIYEECKITRPPQSWCYVEELQ